MVGFRRIKALGYEPVAPDDDLSQFELAAVLTDHSDLDYKRLADQVPAVYDARGVYRRLGITAENVEPL